MAAAKMPMPMARSVFGAGADEAPDAEAEDTEIPEDFEAYAIEAFPDLEGDPVRLKALKDAIHACMRAKSAGEYEE